MSLFFRILFMLNLPAQPAVQWQKTLGGTDLDEARCIHQTDDSGYIIVGNTLSNNGDVLGNHGGWDFWVVKMSSTGSIQWKKTLGGTNNDWPYTIQQTTDGGYIVAGFSESSNGDVSNNHGEKDAWLIKLSNTGTVQWEKAYGGSAWESANSIQQTSDGGYVFAGIAQSSDGDVSGVHGDLDFWVVKINGQGDIEWQKALGGTGEDIANSIKQTSDGGYIVTGRTSSNDGDVSYNHGNVDYWVVKINSAGIIEWQKSLGGTSTEVSFDINQTINGEYIVIGYSSSSNGDISGHHGGKDIWVVRLNNEGEIVWQKSLGGSDQDWGYSIALTSGDGCILAGGTRSSDGDVLGNHGFDDIWLVKLNVLGELEWQRTLGGSQSEVCFSFQQTNDNGYALCGYTWSTDGDVSGLHALSDFWTVKLSPESSPTSEAQTQPLKIHPNPAQKSIFLTIPIQEPILSICISDLLGREVSRQQFSGMEAASIEMDIAALEKGFYWVRAVVGLGRVYCGKFWKE